MTSVLHLLSSSEFHGAEAAVLELCRGQIESGLKASVFLFCGDGGAAEDISARFERAGVPLRSRVVRKQIDRAALRELRDVVEADSIDILHSHKYKMTPYALLAGRGRRAAVVATYHNWLHESSRLALYSRIDKFLARFCDACIGVSSPVAQELRRHVPDARVSVIHNGIDVEHWRPPERVDDTSNPLVVGFVGRLSRAKGADRLLDALARVDRAGGRAVHGLFVGDGELREELESRATGADLEGRVSFAGTVTNLQGKYAQMDILALPSTNEGCPMVLLEAMAMGVPAVASRVGDIPRLVLDGDTGRLLDVNEPGAIAEAIEEVLGDDGLRAAMGQKSRELIERQFSLELMVNAYSSVYGNVLEKTA